jgi:hypothetical protein
MANKIWVSVDAAANTGVCVWEGKQPLCLFDVWVTKAGKAMGSVIVIPGKEKHPYCLAAKDVETYHKEKSSPTLRGVWELIQHGRDVAHLVMERSSFKSQKSTMLMGEMRGRILTYLKAEEPEGPALHFVDPNTWHDASKQIYNVVWPKGDNGKLGKEVSVKLAERELGVRPSSDDQADAYHVGRWFIECGGLL